MTRGMSGDRKAEGEQEIGAADVGRVVGESRICLIASFSETKTRAMSSEGER